MAGATQAAHNARKEDGCWVYTIDRKCYDLETDGSFVKRSLRPQEWSHIGDVLFMPYFNNHRILNEAAALRFIAEKTNIPVPKLYACFEDDKCAYLITENIPGLPMAQLTPEQRKVVEKEIEGYLDILRSLKSDTWGGLTGTVIPPYRVMRRSPQTHRWKMKTRKEKDLVFCHNDLGCQNILVDPGTLKINAIIDWEYSGFFPKEFEGHFFRRPGASVALKGEENDEECLLNLLRANEYHSDQDDESSDDEGEEDSERDEREEEDVEDGDEDDGNNEANEPHAYSGDGLAAVDGGIDQACTYEQKEQRAPVDNKLNSLEQPYQEEENMQMDEANAAADEPTPKEVTMEKRIEKRTQNDDPATDDHGTGERDSDAQVGDAQTSN